MLRAFPMSLTGATSHWLRNKPSGSITTLEALEMKFLNKYCPPARTAKKMARSTETSDGLVAIQAQLNILGREIKKVNEKVYAAQVGCELCKGPHTPKTVHLKKKENIEQKLRDSTKGIIQIPRIRSGDNKWKNH
ncbi:hypothetical protein Tco_1281438 [Tanacetum coccineum]